MATIISRAVRAMRLDQTLYPEVAKDRRAMAQAVTVILWSAIGGALFRFDSNAIGELLRWSAILTLSWLIWMAIAYFLGTRVLRGGKTHLSFGQFMQQTGFASAPGILRLFAVIPVAGFLIYFAALLWMLATTTVALRATLNYADYKKPFLVALAGFLPYVYMHRIFF